MIMFNRSTADIPDFTQLTPALSIISIIHVLSEADGAWSGRTGRISAQLLEDLNEGPNTAKKVFVCGPEAFNQAAVA